MTKAVRSDYANEGGYRIPGLFEMHIHGAFGVGFESLSGAEGLIHVALELRKRGVSGFLPTILADEAAIARLADAIERSGLYGTTVPGIYVEGPFVNQKKRGGILPGQIAAANAELCERIADAARGMLKIMTVAPEMEGIEAVYAVLKKRGVRISLGHSDMSGEPALPDAPFSVTHLFNAMSGVDHRKGGLANLALSGLARWVEVNSDGIHVSQSAMRIASRCLKPDQLIVTSDAVAPAGMPYGNYMYFGKAVRSDQTGVRYAAEGTLVGSNRLGMDVVKSFAQASGWPLDDVVRSMSGTPRELLGIAPDPDDVFIWDERLGECSPSREAR